MAAIDDLDRHLKAWGADDRACYLARLAVEELGTNIIKYGYDDRNEHAILLSAGCDEAAFRILLQDDGHPFNPCLTPEPDPNRTLQERTPGGWGLSLVRNLIPGLQYERRDDKNLVRVALPRCSPSPGS